LRAWWWLAAAVALAASGTHADTGVAQDLKQAGRDTRKATKKSVRSVKDKTCEFAHGKAYCAGKKLQHKAENAADDLGK
jgi:hypothetical protein